MSKKSNHSKYDELILDLVYRFKLIEKKHIFCLLKSCKKNSKIEERLKHLVEQKKIYKYCFRKDTNTNCAYYSKNETTSTKPYWIPKTQRHSLIVEQIAFYKELNGSKIKCEDFIEGSKVRYDIMSTESDGSTIYYEIELSKKNKWEIREKVNEYMLIDKLDNLKIVFGDEKLRDKAETHLQNYQLKHEFNLLSDYDFD